MQTVVEYTCLGMWLSWLARFAHIEEVGGSSPFIPTKHRGTRRVPLCLVMSTGLEAGGNGAVALVPKTRGCCICLKTIPSNFTMGCPGFCIYLICSKTDRQRCSGTMKTNKNKSQ